MQPRKPNGDLFIPDAGDAQLALERTTHLAVGAHQDDLELMAYHGIASCFDSDSQWFTGITCTNGAGSPRVGPYGHYTDEKMQQVRKIEQRQAATIGRYSAMIQLGYSSSEVKDPKNPSLRDELVEIFSICRPEVVYTHSPADKHDTHIAVFAHTLSALRKLPESARPKKVYGCEIWRALDWMNDEEKVALDIGRHPNIRAAVLGVFDSQITGGKRYDLAAFGRSRANATFFQSHAVDDAEELWYAIDLTPVVADEKRDIAAFTAEYIDRFRDDVKARLKKFF